MSMSEEKNTNENLTEEKEAVTEITETAAVSKTKKKKRKKGMNFLYWFLMAIFIGIFTFCALYLIRYYGQDKKSKDTYEDLRELVVDEDNTEEEDVVYEATASDIPGQEFVVVDGKKILKRFRNLYHKNHDFYGWLKIDGTKIDYPVMYTPDNEEFYLYRDFNKENNNSGTPFVDTASDVELPSDNILIYGHNMQTNTMFHDILQYEKEDFYKKHKKLTFDTIYGEGEYEVIAAFYTQIYGKNDTSHFKYYQFFNAANENDFDNYVTNCKALTAYEIPTTAKYGDHLITLSTCAYHVEDGRFVVVAKKVEDAD